MEREENKSDLVLAMGTSLCGMHADMVVEGAARRRLEDGGGHGAVIVGFQRTRMDNLASLRIFAAIDEVMVSIQVAHRVYTLTHDLLLRDCNKPILR